MRRLLAAAMLAAGAIASLVLLASPAMASDCPPTVACSGSGWTAAVGAAVTGAVVAVAAAAGTALGGPTVGTGTTTEQVVVSGQEAVDIMAGRGARTVVHDGTTYLVPPLEPTGDVAGLASTTTTLPDGTKVVSPDDLAIVQNVPAPTGTTTSVDGGKAVAALVNEGFPTHTGGDGTTYVKAPPNLIHGNVSGIAYGGTTTVDGVEVIDPNGGVVVIQTGPPTVQPPVAAPPVPVPPPPVTTPPAGSAAGPTPDASTGTTPDATQPPRTPTDAASLTASLTQPGTTVITPDNVPAFAPDALRPDGTIKVKNPNLPEAIRKLDGQKVPTPTISGGTIGVDLPLGLGHADVTLRVEGGRLVSRTETSGPIKAVEAASTAANLMNPNMPEVDAGRAVQNRLDRYNRSIHDAGLEVKSVQAESGRVQIVTGRK